MKPSRLCARTHVPAIGGSATPALRVGTVARLCGCRCADGGAALHVHAFEFEFTPPLSAKILNLGLPSMDLPTHFCVAPSALLHRPEHTTDNINGDRCSDGRCLEIVRDLFHWNCSKTDVLFAGRVAVWQSTVSPALAYSTHTHSHCRTSTAKKERAKCSAPSDRDLQRRDKSAAILY